MIWLVAGMGVAFLAGYELSKEYAALAPAIAAAKGFGGLVHPHNPQGPSSSPSSNGKAAQNQ